ncbi:TetR/AcrR family transcriptional regulator [Glycomyces sp. TRM65418]|uniref:TetR/AcrR family transcriptional regulator n=1 Tax=Glycomyces sp. TRM65418 TaxID=2867006 RepID=UPI001D166477|nr:TetR/AcrR family transcriptional regulator [Glycomyces sp. TRM65418]MCC3763803.1 TetR/AcrR family transcriptional regulator [Glycomyces sp. TRM65418]
MTVERRKAPRQAEAERNDRALLEAARAVLATDGAHASVAAIAKRAGVGIGSLYRRYPTKEALFQRLLDLALDQYLAAAEAALADPDPWNGLAGYVTTVIEFAGSLSPLAGMLPLTEEIRAKDRRAGEAVAAVVARAHDAGVLRPDATRLDVELLIEQLGRSPLVEQLAKRGRGDLDAAAGSARARIIAIALDGLRAAGHPPLPGDPPGYELFAERWEPAS